MIKKLYNLTCDGRQFVSVEPPSAVPDSYYSLVEVSYNSYLISSIKGIYVGEDMSEKGECVYSEVILDDQVQGEGDTYLTKINNYIKGLDPEDRSTMVGGIDIIDFRDDNEVNKLQKIFMIGVGSMLVYLYFISLDQGSIGYPFYPIKIECPLDNLDITAIDANVFEYYSYSARLLLNITTKGYGKLWMAQMADFWNSWGPIFPKVLVMDQINLERAAYESVVGYSEFLYMETASMHKYFKSAENIVNDGCKYIRVITDKSIDLLNQKDLDIQKRYRYAIMLITTVATMVLKTIKAETDISIAEVEECKNQCVKVLKDVTNTVLIARNKMLNELEQYQEFVMEDLNRISQESVENVNNKMEHIKGEMIELERKLKIYATRNVQDLEQTKVTIIKNIYDEVPNIVDEVHHRVGGMIKEAVNERVEDNLVDVLEDYKGVAKERLEKDLEPVIQDQINKFKTLTVDEMKNIVTVTKDQAVKTERYATLAKNHHDKMEEIVTDMEIYVNEVKVVQGGEIKSMKEEIKNLKQTVKHLTGIIEGIAQKLGVN